MPKQHYSKHTGYDKTFSETSHGSKKKPKPQIETVEEIMIETLLWWKLLAALPVSIFFCLFTNMTLILLSVNDQLKIPVSPSLYKGVPV